MPSAFEECDGTRQRGGGKHREQGQVHREQDDLCAWAAWPQNDAAFSRDGITLSRHCQSAQPKLIPAAALALSQWASVA